MFTLTSEVVIAINADGRFVAFESFASNLVPGDANAKGDIFLRDRQTGTTIRVSVGLYGAEPDDRSLEPDISPDGQYITFQSLASNLVANDTNGVTDIFLFDRISGTTVRSSLDTFGAEANGDSSDSRVSADGRFTSFSSAASNLAPGDTTPFSCCTDIFVKGDPDPIVVATDIKPGGSPNSVVCHDVSGTLTVAILSSAQFDARVVNASSVRFGKTGTEAAEIHGRGHLEDVNKDRRIDMVFHFQFGATGFSCSDIPAGQSSVTLVGRLTGRTNAGVPFVGEDTLRILGQ